MSNTNSSSWRSRWRRSLLPLALAAAVVGLGASCLLFVDETESVIVERFGEISAVYDREADRGLQWKWPWPIETARSFDRRVQLLNLPAREILTRDKKNITLDAYVCWKIAEPDSQTETNAEDRPLVRFFRSLGDREIASARLESRINSALASRLGQVDLDRLLDVQDSQSGPEDSPGLLQQLADEIREEIGRLSQADRSLPRQMGIEIVDVGFQRLNFPEGNRAAVYERMRSERRKIANRYRAEGLAESKVIRSQAELWAGTLLARAQADAERIRGEAEAEATRILNAAHLQDREFYAVLRTLDGYQRIINPNTTLVLSASNQLLKLMTEGLPAMDEAEPLAEP